MSLQKLRFKSAPASHSTTQVEMAAHAVNVRLSLLSLNASLKSLMHTSAFSSELSRILQDSKKSALLAPRIDVGGSQNYSTDMTAHCIRN